MILSTLALPALVFAQGLVAECDPTLAPSDPDGCGLSALVQTIVNIIEWLQLIIIPIAILMIAIGGFMILTSAGSTERVSKGRSMITIAVIGIIIMLLSTLAIRAVFQFLDVDPGPPENRINVPTNIGGDVL